MLTKEGLAFLLRLTGYIHGHWEDPEWGQRSANQTSVMLGAHTLARGIADAKVRTALQGVLEKAIAEAATKLAAIAVIDAIQPAPHHTTDRYRDASLTPHHHAARELSRAEGGGGSRHKAPTFTEPSLSDAASRHPRRLDCPSSQLLRPNWRI